MKRYSYIAKGAKQKRITDFIDATSRYHALEMLRAQGLVVLSISENDIDSHAQHDAVVTSKRKRVIGVSMSDRSVFFRQLSIALGSGVPLRDALQSIVKDVDNKVFKHALNDVVEKIHDGASFSEAMNHHRHIFSQTTIALVSAAEEAGSMEETLDRIATSLEHNTMLRRKIVSIISYPIFVAAFFVIVCLIITLFVMPQFQEVFSSFGSELPFITRAVFGVNTFILSNGLIITTCVFIVCFAIWLWCRTTVGRRFKDRAVLKIPVLGKCLQKLLVARMCRSLAMMVKGGVPVAHAIELTASISTNVILKESMMNVHDKVVNGMSISDSLAESWLFPNFVMRMVSVGESSGKLPVVLEKVGETYENEVEGTMMVAMSLFEPVVIVVFGAIILGLVLAIYMPVFTVAAGVK